MRRGSSMVSYVADYKTADGYVFRVSLVAFSQRRINTEKKHQIRVLCRQFLQERLPKLTVDEFIKQVPLGNLNNDLLEAAKKLTPLRHIGIKKTKLISSPTNVGSSVQGDQQSDHSRIISYRGINSGIISRIMLESTVDSAESSTRNQQWDSRLQRNQQSDHDRGINSRIIDYRGINSRIISDRGINSRILLRIT